MNRKAIYIALVGLLLIIIALYCGGVLTQVLSNYQEWQQLGGIAANQHIAPPVFKAGYCFKLALTWKGLQCSLLVLTMIGGTIPFFLLRGRRMGDEDGRYFTRSKKGTYGTAAWMERKEMKAVLNESRISDTRDTILGKRNGNVLTLRKDSMLNKHVMVAGSTGSGKSVCYVRPFAMQCLRRGESIILSDPKAELYEDMSGLFKENGYEVRVFNTIDPLHSDSWNCMDDLDGDALTAQIMANIIMNNTTEEERPDIFWKNNESNLLKALALYVDGLGESERSLPVLYQTLTNNSARQLTQIFERLPQTHPARYAASYFMKAEPTVQAGAINGLGIRLQVLQSQAVQGITSRSDIDLTMPAKRKCAYFVLLSDQDSSLDFLTSLFFKFLFLKLVRYADSTKNKRCDVPVNFCLEEFCNIGALGTDFARQLNTIRSRDINVSMIIQALPQLKNRYPNDIWQELLGACDTQLLLGCADNDTAEYFSTRSGDMTVEVESTMVTKKTMSVMQTIPQYRESSGIGRRKLLTVDELLRMPNKKQLIALRGHNVLMAEKFMYKEHPLAKRISKSSIYDYAGVAGVEENFDGDHVIKCEEAIRNESSEDISEKPTFYDQMIDLGDF